MRKTKKEYSNGGDKDAQLWQTYREEVKSLCPLTVSTKLQVNQAFGGQILVGSWAKVIMSLYVMVGTTATQHRTLTVVCRPIIFNKPSKLNSDHRHQYAENVLRLALCYFDVRPSVMPWIDTKWQHYICVHTRL